MTNRLPVIIGISIGCIIVAIVVSLSVVRSRMAKEYRVYASMLIRPDGIANVGDLLRLKPEIREVFSVTNTSSISIVVTLEPPKSTRRIYSGPPAFIFDENGRFVDWSEDIGDDTKFWRKWPISSTNKVSTEKLGELVEPVASTDRLSRASDSEGQN